MQANIKYLTNVHFDVDAAAVLPALLADLNVARPLLVTDPTLIEIGLIERLGLKPVAIYDQVRTNPTEAGAREALEQYRSHDCDGTVAVGGGSSIDLAKAAGLLVEHEPPLSNYALIHGGAERIRGDRLPPLIAVPTTAGSGSEVGRAALVTLDTGRKLALINPKLIPDAAVCDPRLTCSMPAGLTAATGMDALSHCVENLCSPDDNPIADAIAIDGLERGWHHLRRAIDHPNDLEHRREMMVCALAGGMTFQKGLGAVHALSHPLGALERLNLHHGTLNAIFLSHVLEFNLDACQEKMQMMADRLGLTGPADLPGAFADLVRDLGLPTSLGAMGVTADDLRPLAEHALADHCSQSNPRPMTVEDCAALYERARSG
ncbi:MAG: 4-hydroxybutyrate dehydrogenase [Phycisphaeraceae bacterium]|nr:4-hydroxybutyrate dehydrogenase [Phycisphaeraceae bacterium]